MIITHCRHVHRVVSSIDCLGILSEGPCFNQNRVSIERDRLRGIGFPGFIDQHRCVQWLDLQVGESIAIIFCR